MKEPVLKIQKKNSPEIKKPPKNLNLILDPIREQRAKNDGD